jgi:ATP-binding cassette subfamily F protein 3
MIQINNVTLLFGEQTVFNKVNAKISEYDRVGLVGRNGAGKSTLLKIIGKEQEIDSGSIVIQKYAKIAYMPQSVVLKSTKNVYEEALSTYEHLYKLSLEQNDLLEKINKNEHDLAITERYAEIEETLLENNWNRTKAQVQEMVEGLGFDKQKQLNLVDSLSVGWKMRLLLAKLLLQNADFYLFDEPTNHLDLSTKEWFLQFLKKSSFGFVIVCHDRYFLDQLCTSILDVSQGNLKVYHGNYTKFLQTRAEQAAAIEQAYGKQQQLIKERTNWIDRNKAKASKSKQAQSMLKQLNKMDKIELEKDIATVSIKLPQIQHSAQHVFAIENVSHSFEKPIFKNVTFSIERGEKIAIIAPNGTGKTTLFNVIAKKLALQSGSIEAGNNVSVGLFDQDQSKVLDPDKSVFEEVSSNCSATEQEVRNMLGAFLFPSGAMYKKTGVLSGGERNRVAMVKVLLQRANFIMLDEPTNHLDIETKEIILMALQKYEGTILFVSHDQEFVNKLATRIIELSPDGVVSYLGNYNDYLLQKQSLDKASSPAGTKQQKSSPGLDKSDTKDLQKKLKFLESKVEKAQNKVNETSENLFEHDYGSPEYVAIEKELVTFSEELKQATAEWEQYFETLK